MEEKEYLLKTEYIGTRLYRNSENSTNINFHMNRKTIYITTNNTIKTTPGRLIQINAGLNDYNGNSINLTTNATIKILNESITLEFVAGKLNYEYNLDQKLLKEHQTSQLKFHKADITKMQQEQSS